nr:hypothetical protein [Vallitaleaceae bacterium]
MKTNKDWQLLYRLGGAAPFITIFFYLCQLMFISWDNYPATIEQWFILFDTNKIRALFYLNSLDMISIGTLGIMYLALYVRLKEDNQSLMSISLFFSYLG